MSKQGTSKQGAVEPPVHEAEIHRQHVRLKIPIRAEIDGAWFQVDDWSLGGFGVDAEPPAFREGEIFPVVLALPFEDFELTVRLDAELVYRLPDRPRFGCRFTGMTRGQISLFRHIVDRYLTGEIASPDDVLVALGRDSFGPARVPSVDEEGGGLRRVLGWALAGLAGLALAAVVAWGAYERFYRIRVTDARIEVPIYRVSAPVVGELNQLVAVRAPTSEGMPIGQVTGPDGRAYNLLAPCNCTIGQWQAADGAAVTAGSSVALLISNDVPLKVVARVPLDKARTLTPGTPVRLSLPGEGASRTGQIEQIELKVPLESLIDRRPAGRGDPLVPVVVRPDEPLDFDLLGTPVTVDLR
ncbi:MAG TPA: PilZ domain-containing protein [Geminicoccus sp.]|jgi:hypothetical protein|uniref:PilZ domain-containing protein n=1 Tax=Geminicoccus sp. TaxID=2024832 RepID=UPI002E36A270|nr:PilZ domain-containing protein [Geminicoccus sp.]HEX2526988.1 PilZ domain-containing protein [Geminicoccus sp.]